MKTIYLVHCWDGTCEDGWYPWIEKELKKYNIDVLKFNMPNTTTPKIEEWVSCLNDKVDKLDRDTYFIGHSIGCQTILRYLESRSITNIGGMLLVTPWFDLLPTALEDEESNSIAKPWIETKIDLAKIRKFTDNIHCLFSDDDYFVSAKQSDLFKEKLNANVTFIKGKGHISQDDNVYELKEILDISKQMLGIMTDEDYIDIAIDISKNAKYPYGAIIVKNNKIIGRSDDITLMQESMFSHAELEAIESASKNKNLYGDLKGAVMYVSCEPCMMCMGAILYEEFSKVVYAATLKDSNDYYCPEIITNIDDLVKYSKTQIEIVKELHRDKAIEILKKINL